MGLVRLIKNVNYKWHILSSLLVRIALIIYSTYHDEVSQVSYTDIDYKVFTDASRHILNHNSPYDRHTYRYTPLIAILLIPNIVIHSAFGKFLFSIIDLMVGLLIRLLVKNTIKEYDCYKQKFEIKTLKTENKGGTDNSFNNDKLNIKRRSRKKSKNYPDKIAIPKKIDRTKNSGDLTADVAMLVWLYNPLTVAIATRGNCDSIAGFLVLSTLYFLQCKRKYFVAGLIHGLSIHVRLYPLAYSLALFMYLSKYSYYSTEDRRKKLGLNNKEILCLANTDLKKIKNYENKIVQNSQKQLQNITDNGPLERKTIFKKEYILYLIPNFDQIKLITGCLISLASLTYLFYYLYGYKFLYETYIYHLIRKDTRHNFSLYFYLQYLTAGVKNIGVWQKVLIVLPQVVLLLIFSVRYGLNKFSLNFSILTQTVVMITYNTVLTSQYFVWILSVLPLCLWQIKMTKKSAFFLFIIWFAAQAAWLLPAYFLEFHGQNTFLFIWVQSVSFFCANIAILGRLVMNFMPLKVKAT